VLSAIERRNGRYRGYCGECGEDVRRLVDLRLPLADSIVYATARAVGGVVWTQDVALDGLPDVQYVAKRRGIMGSGRRAAAGRIVAADEAGRHSSRHGSRGPLRG